MITVSSIPVGKDQREEGRRPRRESRRRRRRHWRRLGAGREHSLPLSGAGLRLRPERLEDADGGARRQPDPLRALLHRPDRARVGQDTAARTGSRRFHPLEGPELPRARRVQLDGLVESQKAGHVVRQRCELPPEDGCRRVRPGAGHVGDQRALVGAPDKAARALEGPRGDARPLHGPARAPRQQGAVFIVGTGQNRRNFAPYKAQQQGWLSDAAWWTAVSPYVAWWGQEAYASCRLVCVPRSKIADRSRAINEFVQHPARLAFAPNAPPQTGAAKALFDRAYFPLMTAYWNDVKGTAATGSRSARSRRSGASGSTPPAPGRSETRIPTVDSASRGTSIRPVSRPSRGRRWRRGSRSRSGRLRRRRHRRKSVRPDRRVRLVQGSGGRRPVQSGLGDVRYLERLRHLKRLASEDGALLGPALRDRHRLASLSRNRPEDVARGSESASPHYLSARRMRTVFTSERTRPLTKRGGDQAVPTSWRPPAPGWAAGNPPRRRRAADRRTPW